MNRSFVAALAIVQLLASLHAAADTQNAVETLTSTVAPEASEGVAMKVRESRGIDWVALPIPISNPTVGTGLALAVMALYRVGGATSPSNTAAGVFKTDNESKGGGVLQETYLGNSIWQVNGALAKADLNLDFYGIGEDQADQDAAVPISQQVEGGAVWVMARVLPGLSVGPRYRLDSVRVQAVDLPSLDVDLREATLELLVQYDTRDVRFGPAKGWYVELSAGFTDKELGGDISYQRHTLAANWYRTLSPSLVLGARAALCSASDDAPFFAMCQFGQSSDLRGYVVGRYRDQAMFATQVELRWRAWKRLGFVAFGGLGDIAGELSGLSVDDPLSSGGAGVRFLASPQNRVNVGVDVAWADGDSSVYFRIGEAF